MTTPAPRIEAVLKGPDVQGRVSVDVLVALSRELQNSLRRALSNRRPRGGRYLGSIEEACRLDFVGFRKGSAVCEFELAPPRDPATLFGDQGLRAAEEVLNVLDAGEKAAEGWSEHVQPGLLDSLERFARIVGDGIDRVDFHLKSGSVARSATITPVFRAHVRAALAPLTRPGEVRIEGVIWECDWRRHTAELHLPDGSKLELKLSESIEEFATGARRQRVVVHGHGKDGGKPLRTLDVIRIELAGSGPVEVDPKYGSFYDDLSIEELARRQSVPASRPLEDYRSDWLDDESLDDLLKDLRELRS